MAFQVFQKDLAVIGKPEHRSKEAYQVVTGRLDFSSDHLMGKKLHTRVLGSPYARATITSIDTSKAEALPGVGAVCTYKDIKSYKVYGIDFGMSNIILFAGQAVALVAAVDEETAARATELIDVQYEVLPHVVAPEEAIMTGAPLSGAFPDGNVSAPAEFKRGDIEAGFVAADVIKEYTVGWLNTFQIQQLEPHSAVAFWEGDNLYVWSSSQSAHPSKLGIAGPLGLEHHKVHHISHGTGGGFGDKILHNEIAVWAAALAKKAGQPVQVHLNRTEHFQTRGHHNGSKNIIKFGAKKDGTLTAMQTTTWGDGGESGFAFSAGEPRTTQQTYKIPNVKSVYYNVSTNKPPTGAWRGPPDNSGSIAYGIALNMFAEDLGMDPLDFMEKNLFDGTQAPDQDSKKPWGSYGTRENFGKLRSAIGWDTKKHAPGALTLPDGRKHGMGVWCCASNFGSISTKVGAIVNLTYDGKALLNIGISRVGNGLNDALCHIVAETLGISYADTMFGGWGDTDYTIDGGSQGGSTRVVTLGGAFHMAALDCRDQLFETAAALLKVTAAELDARDGKIFVKADPTKFKTHKEVAARAPITGRGYSWPKELQRPVGGFPAGTSAEMKTAPGLAVEVAVDTETGAVEVLEAIAIHDVGRVIFRAGCEKQGRGGILTMIGEVLYWGEVHDNLTGYYLNSNFLDHYHPTALDCNAGKHQLIITESDDACSPYGSKGLGEPVVIPCGAIAVAIHNAIGVWVTEVPISLQRILKALGKA